MGEKCCTLCHNTVSHESYEIIDKLTEEVFSILLLNLDLDDKTEHLMCKTCSAKLYGALEFKSTCLETDSSLLPFVDCDDNASLDLHDVYLKNNENQIMPDQKLCRLCMHLVKEEFVSVDEVNVDLIRLYIPEVNFVISSDPVMCNSCLESFNMFSRFIKDCLDANKKMDSDYSDGSENFEDDEVELKESYFKSPPNRNAKSTTKIPQSENQTDGFKCSHCDFVGVRSRDMKNHLVQHGLAKNIEWYRCLPCNYRTRSTKYFWRHLDHKHKLTGKWHTCADCGYKAKYRACLDDHKCLGKRPARTKRQAMGSTKKRRRCLVCGYSTDSRLRYANHRAEFRDGSCVSQRKEKEAKVKKVFQCEECDYKGRDWQVFKRHMLRHSDQNARQYHCDKCEYRSPLKRAVDYHKRTQHKASS